MLEAKAVPDDIDQAISATLNRGPEVDYLMLADRAEVINTKIYVMGGAIDTLTASYPHTTALGVLVGFRIPWAETNRLHSVEIELRRDGSEDPPLIRMEAQVESGRMPGRNGKDVLIPVALNGPVTFAAAGDYVLTARIGDHGRRHVLTATVIR